MGKVSGVVLLSINTGNVKLDPQFKCYLQLSSFSLCLLKVSRDSGTARTGGFQIGFNGFRPPNKNLKNRFWQEKKKSGHHGPCLESKYSGDGTKKIKTSRPVILSLRPA